MNGFRPKLTSPIVLRFTIDDVLTAYICLVFNRLEDSLTVESVTAFGPREMVRISSSRLLILMWLQCIFFYA